MYDNNSIPKNAETSNLGYRFIHIDWIRLPLFVFGIQNVSFALLASTYSLLSWTGWTLMLALLCFALLLAGSQYQVKGSLISPIIISLLMMMLWFGLSIFYPYVPISVLPFEVDPLFGYGVVISTALMIPLFIGIKIGGRIGSKYRLSSEVALIIVGAFIFVGLACAAVVFLDSDRNLGLDAGVQTFEYSDAEFEEHVARMRDRDWTSYTTIAPSTYRQAVFFAAGFLRIDPSSANVEVFLDPDRMYWLVALTEPDEDPFSLQGILIRGEDGRILAEW